MSYRSVEEVVRDLEARPVEKGGHVYHPIPFPEFSHLKTSSSARDSRAKLAAILGALESMRPGGLDGLKVLDIGANAGYFTFSLAQLGADVTAFEPHSRYAPIGGFLAADKKLKVAWHGVPFEIEKVSGRHFDVCLMLSVFQWLADGGARLGEAARTLREVSRISRYMLFELGFNDGKSCLATSKLNHYAELVRFLERETVYTRFLLLAATRPWGSGRRYVILCSNDERRDDPPLRRILRRMRV